MRELMVIISLLMSVSVFAQSERKYIREGNKLYDNKKYADGELAYRKAIDKKPNSFEAAFNVGNSLYKQGKYLDAATQFGNLIEPTKNKDQLAKLYYNIGNSYLKANKLDESISAYKNSLLKNPTDQDTKFNLSYALRLQKQQQNQKKNDDKNNKDNKDNKDKQNQQNQNKKDQNKQDQQNKQNQQQQQKQQQQKGQQGDKQISPEDAQRMLDAIQNDEKDLQKRLEEKKASSEKAKVLKNW